MQNIAQENNLSETAFVYPANNGYSIRWFTPSNEVELCGHATLAAAFVLFHFYTPDSCAISFRSASGILTVSRRENELIALNFPKLEYKKVEMYEGIKAVLGIEPSELYTGKKLMAIYESEDQILSVKPDFERMKKLDEMGVIITAPGMNSDFVSRFFAPKYGINEDPVTGSAHCMLIPYWAKRLNKKTLFAKQVSRRQGELYCNDLEDRVEIAGRCILYLKGEIDFG
jgi:PhzF family phenazine biosynthesis protein